MSADAVWHGSHCKMLEVLQLMLTLRLLCAEWCVREEAAPAAATSDGWCGERVRCHRCGWVRAACGGWIWSVSGGAVGAEGACGWWLVAAGVGSGVGRGVATAQ